VTGHDRSCAGEPPNQSADDQRPNGNRDEGNNPASRGSRMPVWDLAVPTRLACRSVTPAGLRVRGRQLSGRSRRRTREPIELIE